MRRVSSVLFAFLLFLATLPAFAAITKTSVVVENNITMTAGAASVTSPSTSVSGSYHTICHIQFTNGTAGPTVAPFVTVQTSEVSGGTYVNVVTVNGDTTASSVSERDVVLDDAVENVQFVYGGNTGQNVTLRIVVEEITGI